jgi:hypothetical protein
MTIDKTIMSWSKIDVDSNFTPDLPSLRYFGGGIPVFIWDNLTDYTQLKSALGQTIDASKEVEVRHAHAITVNKYIPWYNLLPDVDSYAGYCLEEPADIDFLSVADYTIGTPLQLEGHIVYVSLAALQELDAYYENETNFDRVKIKVYTSKFYKQPLEVFTWMNNVDQVAEFDTQTNEYVLRDGVDPVPFRDTMNETYVF